MRSRLLQFLARLLTGLIAGTFFYGTFAVLPTFNRTPPGVHLRFRTTLMANNKVLVMAMVLAAVVALALVAWDARHDKAARRWGLGALLLTIVSLLVTRFGSVPLNLQIKTWNPESPPAEWLAVLRVWDRYNLVRTATSLAAFACMLLGDRVSRPPPPGGGEMRTGGRMAALLAVVISALGGCAGPTSCIVPSPGAPPATHLTDLGLVSPDLRPDLIGYAVRTPFYSDGLAKERFLVLPPGRRIDPTAADWDFPVGALLVKTFVQPTDARQPQGPKHRLETRVLQRVAGGFVAAVYVWNEQQTEAVCSRGGVSSTFAFVGRDGNPARQAHRIPALSACRTCHGATPDGLVARALGWRSGQLDLPTSDRSHVDIGQIERLVERGVFVAAPPAPPRPAPRPRSPDPGLELTARRYLDVNCAPCHAPQGLAGYRGLFFGQDQDDPLALGVYRRSLPVDGREIVIVPGQPRRSSLIARMVTANPASRMPASTNLLVDEEGLALLTRWIESMDPRASAREADDLLPGRIGVGVQAGFAGPHDAVTPAALTARWERDDVWAVDVAVGLPGAGLGLAGWADLEASYALNRLALWLSGVNAVLGAGPMVARAGSAFTDGPASASALAGPTTFGARAQAGLRWSWLRGRLEPHLTASTTWLLHPRPGPLFAVSVGLRTYIPR